MGTMNGVVVEAEDGWHARCLAQADAIGEADDHAWLSRDMVICCEIKRTMERMPGRVILASYQL